MNSIVKEKSYAFAIRIVKVYQYLTIRKKEFVISKQVVRSGTSIGANVHEALQGQSKKDFTAKMSIALKEASETEYWLNLLRDTGYLSEHEHKSIVNDCMEIGRMLTSIVKTSREKNP